MCTWYVINLHMYTGRDMAEADVFLAVMSSGENLRTVLQKWRLSNLVVGIIVE